MNRRVAILAAIPTLVGCGLQLPGGSTPGPAPTTTAVPEAPCDYRALGLNGSYYLPEIIAEACARGPILDPDCTIPGQVSTDEGTCVWPAPEAPYRCVEIAADLFECGFVDVAP